MAAGDLVCEELASSGPLYLETDLECLVQRKHKTDQALKLPIFANEDPHRKKGLLTAPKMPTREARWIRGPGSINTTVDVIPKLKGKPVLKYELPSDAPTSSRQAPTFFMPTLKMTELGLTYAAQMVLAVRENLRESKTRASFTNKPQQDTNMLN
ncbi:hypothetical protein MUK42_37797 [Musa troglodytarum]|uniref:Uncharacterized protein n=1 Tax=Musa troglodytarum TaxID=320322 RepID=A0A9E7KCH3_9LILI|nr:hypothetical protein MUK42_37797 [Musa troglodytarum]